MEEKQDFFAADGDADATLVTPRFDEVEAETARPVVPLADVPSVEGDSANAPVYAAHAGAPVYGANRPQQRSWTLALVVISALVGTVLGGAGLRFYQQRQRAAATVAAEPATPAQVETAQPSPAQQIVEEHQTAALPAPVTIVEDPGDPEAAPASTSRRDDGGDERRDDSAKPPKSSDKEREDESKKKNDDDGDAKPDKEKTPKARRVDVLTEPPPQAVGIQVGQSDEAEPEARPTEPERDEIFNERRQQRREQRERRARQRDVDRVRGIFEGQPPN